MAEVLEKTNSSYFVAFKEIFRDVVAGRPSFFNLVLLSSLICNIHYCFPCSHIRHIKLHEKQCHI